MIDCKRAAGHLVSLVAVGLFLSGCGGGGGSSDASGAGTGAGLPATATVVTGSAAKGPIAGASVSLFELDAFGYPASEPTLTTTTDAAGNFSVTLPGEVSGSLLVETSGGSFVDESDQEANPELKRRIQLGQGEGLWSVIAPGQTSVAITPYTDALVERARLEGSVSGDFEARLDSLRALLADEVGFDVFTTIPADPLAPAASATTAQRQYALLLGGIANVINNVSIQLGLAAPDFEVIRAVIQDLTDGRIDGRRFNERVEVYLDDSIADLPDNVDFDLELNRFRNNNFASFEGTALPVIDPAGLSNIAPFAQAGEDVSVPQSTPVQLSGAESIDLDGSIAAYQWTQTSGPVVELSGADTSTVSFVLPAAMVETSTLTFELTVTDTIGATGKDSITVIGTPALAERVFLVEELDLPFQFGRDVDPGGGLVSFSPDGTGLLVDQDGSTAFDWTSSGLVLTLDFARVGGYVVDEYTTFSQQDQQGRQDELRVTETINSLVLTMVEDNQVRDQLSLREIGNRTTVNVTAGTPASTETIDDTDPIIAYDLARAQELFPVSAGQVRALLTNVSSAVPTLTDAPALELDRLTFVDGSTGSAFEKGETFSWSIQSDGHLRIVFEGGDVGDYYLLNSRPSGDVVAAEYTYTDGTRRIGVESSYVRDPDDNWNPATVPGIYLSRGSTRLDDDSRVADDVNYRLNPDGTGLVEFDFIDLATGARSPTASPLGICWSVQDGELVIDRSWTENQFFAGSVQPTAAYCGDLVTDDIRFRREQFLYDIEGDGSVFKTVIRQRDNSCSLPGDEECSLPITGYTPRILEKTASFSAQPPLLFPDVASTKVGTPVQIEVLANDEVVSDVDPATLDIVGTPVAGTVSVDSVTGVVTFTPDGSGKPGVFYYRVRDVEENLSAYVKVDVEVDPPVAIAPNQVAEQGEVVTLDASESTDNSAIVSYQWTPVSGIGVALSDPASATPSFTVPTLASLLASETLVFELVVTDDVGQTSATEVFVEINPRLTTELVLVDDLPIEQRDPLAFFGDSLTDSGDVISLAPDGTGTLIAPDGSGSFDWTVNGNELTLDFTPYGGFIPDVFSSFRDLNGDGIQEQIEETRITDQVVVTLVENGAGVDLVDITASDTVTVYNVTANELVSTDVETEVFRSRLFDASLQIPFVITDGETRVLVSNSSTNNPLLRNAPEAEVDELTFAGDGTGYARYKDESFDWMIDDDGHLRVQFADGEVADFYHRKETRAGSFVTALYHYTDNTTRAFANLMYRDNRDFAVGTVPGIYLQYNPVQLDDGSVYYERAWRSARPDGTGQGEFESIDPATGEVSIASSSRGICWSLEADDSLYFNRTPSIGQRYPGSRTPDPSHCASLVNSDVEFGRIYTLFDALPETVTRYGAQVEQLQVIGRNLVNECDCDDPLGIDGNFPVIFEFIPFDGNPGFAVDDNVDVTQGVPTVIDILSNDIDGDFAIDPASIVIELEPIDGTVSVDPVTGDLTYTSDLGVEDDVIYYRFRDANGNLSSLGRVSISVDPGIPVAFVESSGSVQQGAIVTLDGSGSTDDSEIVSYLWTQVSGTPVELSDATSSSPTFTAPSFVNVTDAEELVFELAVTDNLDQTGITEAFVTIEPKLPSEFVLVDDLFLQQRSPLAFFGDIIDTGELATLNVNGTGTIITLDGVESFDWTSTEDTLSFDFVPYGGSTPYIEESTFDVDDDNVDEVVTETYVTNFADIVLLDDGPGIDLIDITVNETKTVYNVSDDVEVSSEPSVEMYTSRLFAAGVQIPFGISDGETRLFKTNVSTNNPRLDFQPEPVLDELTFDAGGSGFARFKNQSFNWTVASDGHLMVDFADGESAEYFHLDESAAGDFASTAYHYTDGSSRASAFLMYRDTLDFADLGVPGIHLWYEPIVLEDDSVYYQRIWRYLRPDGTGQLERELVDPSTGVATINVIGAGICWDLDPGQDDLTVTLSVDFGQRYPGSRTPTPGHCASLVNSQVITGTSAGGINSLYGILPDTVLRYGEERDQLQLMSRVLVNDCACDDPLGVAAHVPGVVELIPFDGNPGFAVNDSVDATPAVPIVIDILANDIAGDASIDPTSVMIELEPNGGTFSVDPATGEITYTPENVIYDDVIYYRFRDASGNLSTLGTVDIAVGTNDV
ncbi:MAG: Ig-like domain-containing protein [Pseudomonadota bacterium]